jgi:tetratricopeptide (TPR) repeat protein
LRSPSARWGLLSLRLSAFGASAEQRGVAGSARAAAESVALRALALELAYNLDHEEAIAAFRAAIAADPDDSVAYRLVAATMWIMLLFRQGAVTVDDYLGQVRSDLARKPPAPELEAVFRAHIDRALTLAERRLRGNPANADAHFQVGAAHGYLTSYKATVEGRVLGGFRAARRAYNEHERVMDLGPRRKDAGLIVGMYRYAVSTLSAPMRLLAGIAGFGGGRQRGLRLIEDAAAYPSDVQTNALLTLILIYNREERYDDALRVIGELQRRYPRNRLLWLESASAALRAGRPRSAAGDRGRTGETLTGSATEGIRWEARWRYYGAALVALREVEAADRELQTVLTGEAHDWLRGRARKELGKLADLPGDRARATDAYRLAVRICRAHHDSASSDEAAALMKRRYR